MIRPAKPGSARTAAVVELHERPGARGLQALGQAGQTWKVLSEAIPSWPVQVRPVSAT